MILILAHSAQGTMEPGSRPSPNPGCVSALLRGAPLPWPMPEGHRRSRVMGEEASLYTAGWVGTQVHLKDRFRQDNVAQAPPLRAGFLRRPFKQRVSLKQCNGTLSSHLWATRMWTTGGSCGPHCLNPVLCPGPSLGITSRWALWVRPRPALGTKPCLGAPTWPF